MLDRILEIKREELRRAQEREPLASLRARALSAPRPRSLATGLRGDPGHRRRRPAIIAEVKLRSPSAGEIRPGADPAVMARTYERAGAAAISVLTDATFFGGDLAHLEAVRVHAAVPVLRKDFLIDEHEVFRARAAGADAVLLIVTLLGPDRLRDLLALTHELGMEALVEAHDAAEVQVALDAGARIVGVNNRDLRTLEVDPRRALRLRAEVPRDRLFVAESGVRTVADVAALAAVEADAVLVGEVLMRSPDPAAVLASLHAGRR
jgi:indole-3-glycerol phosphate synthase